jgi:hypothetical protein
MKASRIVFGGLALAASTAFAGTAEVRFIDPEKFADLGNYKWEESVNMDDLTHHIQKLARQLPEGQVLHVDVLDVDLAGEPRDTRKGRIRVARDVSYPVIRLRYTLESGGRAMWGGEERITDLNYRHHIRDAHYSTTSLYYEKRLLDEWFQRSFAPDKQAYAH